MEYWDDILAGLSTNASKQFLFWNIVVALLATLIGWFLRGGAVRRWKKKHKAKEGELNALTAEYNGFKEKYNLQEADLKKANLEIEELQATLRRMEQEKAQMQNDLTLYTEQYQSLKGDYDGMKTEHQSFIAKIEDQESQLVLLKEENTKLNVEANSSSDVLNDLASMQSNFTTTKTQLSALEERLILLEEENANLKDNLNEVQITAEQSAVNIMDNSADADALTLSIIEEKLTALEEENITLKQEMDLLKGTSESTVMDYSTTTINTDDTETQEEDIEEEEQEEIETLASEASEAAEIAAMVSPQKQSARAKSALASVIGIRIKTATAAEKDDFKKINGIGPFIEQKLNDLGIYTYEQIGQFDEGLIDTLTNAIQFFPGRIQRDDWVGQATELHRLKNINFNTSKKKKAKNPTDLKVVEGIGPKIEQLLKDAGIQTWAALAESDVLKLREILEAAGSRYRIHNPTTWPDQAKLASLGEWQKLKQFQEYLTGGKDMNAKG